MNLKYIDVCTGLSAATLAWHPLGWRPVVFCEVDRFPCLVLAHHYPDVPNHGDFTTLRGNEYGAADVLVGGTPCQDFSVTGLRAGMDGKRGQLTIEYAALAHRARTKWMVWENVTGVLSIDGGEAFALFLSALSGRTVSVPGGGWQNSGVIVGEPGAYGLAYRVLDAQYFGVPQRRRRVFVVGYLGDWRRAAAVLLEFESLLGNPAPGKAAGKGASRSVHARSRKRSFWAALAESCGMGTEGRGVAAVAPTLSARAKGGGGLGTDFDCDGGLVVGGGANSPLDGRNRALLERRRDGAAGLRDGDVAGRWGFL
jgi:DNA (cytosine-5)-methyltransferase 1